jgi:predicted RNase H-like nuclease
MTLFIGIDLAWRSENNPSGAAILRGDQHAAELLHVAEPLRGNEEVLAYVRRHVTEEAV